MDLWRSKEGFQHDIDEARNEGIMRIGEGGRQAQNLVYEVWLNPLGVTCKEEAKKLPKALPKWSHTILEDYRELYICPRHPRRLQKIMKDDGALHVSEKI